MSVVVYSVVSKSYLKSAREDGVEQSSWKFILIETPDALHFVCGPVLEYEYHANLVASFCDREEIGSVWERKPDMVGILDPNIQVRGGGHMRLDLVAKTAKIGGRSTAYGSFDPDDLIELQLAGTFLNDYEFRFRSQ